MKRVPLGAVEEQMETNGSGYSLRTGGGVVTWTGFFYRSEQRKESRQPDSFNHIVRLGYDERPIAY